MRATLYTTVAAFALIAIPASAQTTPGAPSTTQSSPAATEQMTPQDFVTQAAIGNMFEIQSSQWARENIKDPEIQELAQNIITDHEKAAADLKAAAGDLTLPTELDPEHVTMIEELEASDDSAATYLEQQAIAHENAIAFYGTFASEGENAELTTFAESTLPVLQRHQEHIKTTSAAQTPNAAAASVTTSSQSTATNANPAVDTAPVIALTDWNYDELYANGWSAEEFIDEAEVKDKGGETIGDIENILVGEDGKILSLIVEVGGFLDIGDTHVSVPWEQVTLGDTREEVTVPINEENVEDYSIYGDWGYFTKVDADVRKAVNDDLLTGPRVWKAGELIDDYVLLDGGVNTYGYVDDLIFNRKGMLQAVVVSPDVAVGLRGRYAYPYHGYSYGFHPGYPFYALPYTQSDIADVAQFDEEKLKG